MNFPKFWALGSSGNFSCWRWSNQSAGEAQASANQAAQQLAERFAAGEYPPKKGGYYPNRPFREQVLQEIKNGSAEPVAVITRNSYGCLVLNTARVMFVDIDLPEPKKSGGFFQKLFGKTDPTPSTGAHDLAVSRIEDWTRNNSGWGWRVYRTRAGLRLLATHALVEADADATHSIFAALGTDPLYQRLCKTQKCFRARLTPKPWRCGVREKPERWPWMDSGREQKFQKWESHYKTMADRWATCLFVRQIGSSTVHPTIEPILKFHDEMTKAESKLELA